MSSATDNTVYVVTGANRGIGLGLVKLLLARPRTTVVASVRNDESAATLKTETSSSSSSTTYGEGSTLHIVQLDFSSAIAPSTVRERVVSATSSSGGIDHIDVLINNAAWISPLCPTLETTAEDLRNTFETNAIAPTLVFQGLWPLLQKSKTPRPSGPKLISVSSSVGCIGEMEMPGGSYGAGKAALNWLGRSLHCQLADEGLVSVVLHPGWVQTRAGDMAAKDWGYAPGPPDTVEDCVVRILGIIDEATREKYSGQFVTSKGDILPW